MDFYQQCWNAVHLEMLAGMQALAARIRTGMNHLLHITDPVVDARSDEFKISMEIMLGEDGVIGLDYALIDAEDDEGGVAICLRVIGYGGLVLGGYFPYNYTENYSTKDTEEARRRVHGAPINSLAEHVLKSLGDDHLRRELARQGVMLPT